MLRITIYATLVVRLMLGAASAQPNQPTGIPGYSNAGRTDAEKKNDRDLDRAYQHTIKSGADAQKKNSDPWGDVRPAPSATTKNKQQ